MDDRRPSATKRGRPRLFLPEATTPPFIPDPDSEGVRRYERWGGVFRKETAVLAVLTVWTFSDCVRGPLWPSSIRVAAVGYRPLGDSCGLPDGTSYSTWGVFPACTWCNSVLHPAVAAGKICYVVVVWEERHEMAWLWAHTAHLSDDRYT